MRMQPHPRGESGERPTGPIEREVGKAMVHPEAMRGMLPPEASWESDDEGGPCQSRQGLLVLIAARGRGDYLIAAKASTSLVESRAP